ncbi:hypothetical protein GCM10011506_20120 [Marivirga lumbricoides]|uniref:TonB-dependent receptor n=1 Tax=Marivirga lumbricoides TaxID=1046115 RepID=A0ABQ1M4Q8_9BACT|nr:hypothetical protein GCM10011506_20120 [Marivirga lumbricoides]
MSHDAFHIPSLLEYAITKPDHSASKVSVQSGRNYGSNQGEWGFIYNDFTYTLIRNKIILGQKIRGRPFETASFDYKYLGNVSLTTLYEKSPLYPVSHRYASQNDLFVPELNSAAIDLW